MSGCLYVSPLPGNRAKVVALLWPWAAWSCPNQHWGAAQLISATKSSREKPGEVDSGHYHQGDREREPNLLQKLTGSAGRFHLPRERQAGEKSWIILTLKGPLLARASKKGRVKILVLLETITGFTGQRRRVMTLEEQGIRTHCHGFDQKWNLKVCPLMLSDFYSSYHTHLREKEWVRPLHLALEMVVSKLTAEKWAEWGKTPDNHEQPSHSYACISEILSAIVTCACATVECDLMFKWKRRMHLAFAIFIDFQTFSVCR